VIPKVEAKSTDITSAKEVLTVREVSSYLRLSESIVRRLVKAERMPYKKIGGSIRFYLPAITQWLSSGGTVDLVSDTPAQRANEIWNLRRVST